MTQVAKVAIEEAVGSIEPDERLVLPPGCGEALAFERELAVQRDRLAGLRISSGLLLSDYPFLRDGHAFRYSTWHVMPPIRDRLSSGEVEFFPIRGSMVTELLRRGVIGADVAVVQVSPPDRHGFCSLGVSGSYTDALVRLAGRVIAIVNEQMPRVHGDCWMHVSEIDLMVEADEPLVAYRGLEPDPVSERIGERVAELVPDGAVLQIGIGNIPEAVLSSLAAAGRRGLTLWGMATDGIRQLEEAGALARPPRPAVVTAELMGSPLLFEFAHDNPSVRLRPFEAVLDPPTMAAAGRLVSVNSALQVDLTGQVNAETVGGRQISGIGGSFDFIQGAFLSGGRSIIALPSEAGGGRHSRIVPSLAAGTPVSVPRHHIQTVVTEHGVAELEGLSALERAAALAEIASPRFRDELREAAAGDRQALAVADV